jgi:hypothetical protein
MVSWKTRAGSVPKRGAALARDVEDDGQGIRLSPPISISRGLIEHWYRQQKAEPGRRAAIALPPPEHGPGYSAGHRGGRRCDR